MTIAERLVEDMKTSMKAGEADRTGVLRLLRGAMKNEEIKLGHPLSEAEAMKVLQREAKQRRDSMEAYVSAGRPELAANEENELAVIGEYLPEAMSQSDLEKLAEDVIRELGATGPAQMGAVIGVVMQRAEGRAEGGAVAAAVKAKLSEQA